MDESMGWAAYVSIVFLAAGPAIAWMVWAERLRRWMEDRIPLHPRLPIPGGWVRVGGRTADEATQTAPVTGRQCAAWRVLLRGKVFRENSWQEDLLTYLESPVPLRLQLLNGEVLVLLENAQWLDFPIHGQEEPGTSPLPTQLMNQAHRLGPFHDQRLYDIEEIIIPANYPLTVSGWSKKEAGATTMESRPTGRSILRGPGDPESLIVPSDNISPRAGTFIGAGFLAVGLALAVYGRFQLLPWGLLAIGIVVFTIVYNIANSGRDESWVPWQTVLTRRPQAEANAPRIIH